MKNMSIVPRGSSDFQLTSGLFVCCSSSPGECLMRRGSAISNLKRLSLIISVCRLLQNIVKGFTELLKGSFLSTHDSTSTKESQL